MSHELNKKLVEMRREASEHKHLAHSKEMLRRNINNKIKTTMITALSEFEKMFGYLWGIGKKEKELTEEEKLFREKWQITRTNILNKGNDQIRFSNAEIDQYTVKFNKNEYNFLIKDKKGLIKDD